MSTRKAKRDSATGDSTPSSKVASASCRCGPSDLRVCGHCGRYGQQGLRCATKGCNRAIPHRGDCPRSMSQIRKRLKNDPSTLFGKKSKPKREEDR